MTTTLSLTTANVEQHEKQDLHSRQEEVDAYFYDLHGRKQGHDNDDKTKAGEEGEEQEDDDEVIMYAQLKAEALEVARDEPELRLLLHRTVLHPHVQSWKDAIAHTVCYRLLGQACPSVAPPPPPPPGAVGVVVVAAAAADDVATAPAVPGSSSSSSSFCPYALQHLLRRTMDEHDNVLELGETMAQALRRDVQAVRRRDPAVDTYLQVVLFGKGFAALACHRAAYRLWNASPEKGRRKKYTALFLQSQASAAFGLDIHPGAEMGSGIMLDHGTGIVIGETAKVGRGTTLLHGVTLGGTGKETGDRHPKVGAHCLIGANASILGNIAVGRGVKIGAGSVVIKPIPHHATAVGVPAKIIGRAAESKPGSDVDETLAQVTTLHKTSGSTASLTASMTSSSEREDSASAALVASGKETFPNATDVPSKASVEKKQETNLKNNANANDDHHYMPEPDPRCPYRDYWKLSAHHAPAGSINVSTLHTLLKNDSVPLCQLGAVLFALDDRGVGFCSLKTWKAQARQVLMQETNLSEPRIEELLLEAQQHVAMAGCCGAKDEAADPSPKQAPSLPANFSQTDQALTNTAPPTNPDGIIVL